MSWRSCPTGRHHASSLLCQGPKCQQGDLPGRHADCGEALDDPDCLQNVNLISTSKMELPPHVQFGAKLVLGESRQFWSKEFWAPAALTSTLRYYLGASLRGHEQVCSNTVDSLKAAIVQAVANLSSE
ncbi:Transposable element tcb1 transposase [Caligus rogercresseyi]|uniref:Transposable element tcb1 transposase n=1 Tax=Caligus rogercresseyi TaxID=217165 RepID=A0A7T8HFR8_CALRO|nr:Transposable element tcb1 transposase [Caligus rogercresseyi]